MPKKISPDSALRDLEYTINSAIELVANKPDEAALYGELVRRACDLKEELMRKQNEFTAPELIQALETINTTLKHLSHPKESELDLIDARLQPLDQLLQNKVKASRQLLLRWRLFYFFVGIIVAVGIGVGIATGVLPIVLGAVGSFLTITAIAGVGAFPSVSIFSLTANIVFGLLFEKIVEGAWEYWQDRRFNNAVTQLEKSIPETSNSEDPMQQELINLAREVIADAKVLKGMSGSSASGLREGILVIKYALDAYNKDSLEEKSKALNQLLEFEMPRGWLSDLYKKHHRALLVGGTLGAFVSFIACFLGFNIGMHHATVILLNSIIPTMGLPLPQMTVAEQAEGFAIGLVAGRVRDLKLAADDKLGRRDKKLSSDTQKEILSNTSAVSKFKTIYTEAIEKKINKSDENSENKSQDSNSHDSNSL